MKIKLNKDHLNIKAGDEITVTAEEAEYFRRMGMVAKSDYDKVIDAIKEVETQEHTNVHYVAPEKPLKVKKHK